MKKENTLNSIHRNSCGEPIYDKDGSLAICCGDDLGGDNGEFAQCKKCREKDYIDAEKEDKSLSEKRKTFNDLGNPTWKWDAIPTKHVKEKVQNAQRRLKEEIGSKDKEYDIEGNFIEKIINKIFLEEFGKKLI